MTLSEAYRKPSDPHPRGSYQAEASFHVLAPLCLSLPAMAPVPGESPFRRPHLTSWPLILGRALPAPRLGAGFCPTTPGVLVCPTLLLPTTARADICEVIQRGPVPSLLLSLPSHLRPWLCTPNPQKALASPSVVLGPGLPSLAQNRAQCFKLLLSLTLTHFRFPISGPHCMIDLCPIKPGLSFPICGPGPRWTSTCNQHPSTDCPLCLLPQGPVALTQLGLRAPHDLARFLPDGLAVFLQLVEALSPP